MKGLGMIVRKKTKTQVRGIEETKRPMLRNVIKVPSRSREQQDETPLFSPRYQKTSGVPCSVTSPLSRMDSYQSY
jgi:hypothetical protein